MGLLAVELENEWLKAVVLPEVGCKIQSLMWKPAGKQILWQNPRLRPRPYAIDANFDNYWSGGWDDAFPTCDACDYNGEHYPNLGELRSVEWSVDALEQHRAQFSAFGPISPVRARKMVTLDLHQPVLRMQYQIQSLSVLPLDYIWGTHPALQVNEHTVLRIPGQTGIVGIASAPGLGVAGQIYSWPLLGASDMSRVQPASSGQFCGHYVTDLQAGWFSVEDRRSGDGVLFAFPRDLCPNLWLWMCYGGWRGYGDVIVVEPWTSRPMSLDQAVAAGLSRRLEAGTGFDIEIRVTPYRVPAGFEDALRRIEYV
jgi:Domain of unknown function (DUF5107)